MAQSNHPDGLIRMIRVALITILMATLAFPIPGEARTSLDVTRFGQIGSTGLVVDTAGFQALALDLAQVLGSHSAGSSVSTGAMGLDLELDFAFSPLAESTSHWETVGNPRLSSLETLHLSARKGLPYGFQLGVHAGHLIDSRVWSVGGHLKYSILEGLNWFPDVAIRAGSTAILGVRALDCFTVESDVMVSKAFGVFGVMAMTTYGGYSLQYVEASTHVIGAFDANQELVKFVIPQQRELQHRGIIGLQFWVTHVTLGIEAILAPNTQTYAFKLGANL